MEIPNANNKNNNGNDIALNSLCRSDSWQFVSDAGSIRDNHISNHFSSPDSLNSLRKDSSNSPLFGSATPEDRMSHNHNNKLSSNSRRKRLYEVRSIFNSVYTSLNLTYNNGCRFNTLVEQYVPFYNSARQSAD